MDILSFLIIGGIAGWLAGKIMKGSGYGLWANVGIGVVGAMIGGYLLGQFGMQMEGLIERLLTATVGAVLLLWLAKLISES